MPQVESPQSAYALQPTKIKSFLPAISPRLEPHQRLSKFSPLKNSSSQKNYRSEHSFLTTEDDLDALTYCDDDDRETFLKKSVMRQQNLKQLVESPVCVVGDPEIIALDGLPSIELIEEDLNSVGRKSVKKHEHIYEEYVTNMSSVKFAAVINKISQTKKTRNMQRSESLLHRKIIGRKPQFGQKSNQEIMESKVTDYIDELDIKRYHSSQISSLKIDDVKLLNPIDSPTPTPRTAKKRRKLLHQQQLEAQKVKKPSKFDIKNMAYKLQRQATIGFASKAPSNFELHPQKQ